MECGKMYLLLNQHHYVTIIIFRGSQMTEAPLSTFHQHHQHPGPDVGIQTQTPKLQTFTHAGLHTIAEDFPPLSCWSRLSHVQ